MLQALAQWLSTSLDLRHWTWKMPSLNFHSFFCCKELRKARTGQKGLDTVDFCLKSLGYLVSHICPPNSTNTVMVQVHLGSDPGLPNWFGSSF